MSNITWSDAAAEVDAFGTMRTDLDGKTLEAVARHLRDTAPGRPATLLSRMPQGERLHDSLRLNDGLD
jgi:hypothetical protein